MSDPNPNPSGFCMCGCGERTPIARKTQRSENKIMGCPTRYLPGHHGSRGRKYVIDPESGCWEWQLNKNNRGYGITSVAGERWLAHRAMYTKHVGPIPEGLQLDHLCRNKGCVNPEHLEPVTHAENLRRGPHTKLTPADVLAIRVSDEPRAVLAERFGITAGYVSSVRTGRTKAWRDLPVHQLELQGAVKVTATYEAEK